MSQFHLFGLVAAPLLLLAYLAILLWATRPDS
jgi:hypothetical protein